MHCHRCALQVQKVKLLYKVVNGQKWCFLVSDSQTGMLMAHSSAHAKEEKNAQRNDAIIHQIKVTKSKTWSLENGKNFQRQIPKKNLGCDTFRMNPKNKANPILANVS